MGKKASETINHVRCFCGSILHLSGGQAVCGKCGASVTVTATDQGSMLTWTKGGK